MTVDSSYNNSNQVEARDEAEVKCIEIKDPKNQGVSDEEITTRQSQNDLSFFKRLRQDAVFCRKFVIFLCICYSFFTLGFSVGIFGPTLLDLQRITRVRLDQVSMFFISHTIGYLVSAMVTGLVFHKFNKILQMFVPSFALTAVVAVIPWCSIYEIMVTIHFCKGLCLGFIDAVGNGILLHLYGKDVKTYMQVLHFMFAFGGIFAPILSAPFLTQEYTTNSTHITFRNVTNVTYYIQDFNSFNTNKSVSYINEESEVYKAYSIVAAVSFSSALSFLFLYIKRNDACPTVGSMSEEHEDEQIPTKLKILALSFLSFFIIFYTAVEDTYAGFLTTFSVKHFHWTKASGSFATSVFWTSYAVGRFSGIFIVNLFRQARLLRVYSLILLSGCVCLLATTLTYYDFGVWVASVVLGFAMSIFFPIFFSWTEEKFFHVDGKITALIMTCAMIGVIINPIILGQVMEKNAEWFAYILLIESCLSFVFFSICVCISSKIKKFGLSKQRDIEIEIELDNSKGLLDKPEENINA